MNTKTILVFFLCALFALCSSLHYDLSYELEEEVYVSSANGFWPMPGSNIANNGYSDMGYVDFSKSISTTTLTPTTVQTITPPVLDREELAYVIQQTTSLCYIQCLNSSTNTNIWNHSLPQYPCNNALLVISGDDVLSVVYDNQLFLYQLVPLNHSYPPTGYSNYSLGYPSTFLIPLTEELLLLDNADNATIHSIYITPNCSGNCTNSTTPVGGSIVDVNTFIPGVVGLAPAAVGPFPQAVDSIDEGLASESYVVYSASGQVLYAYNLLTKKEVQYISPLSLFYSNIAIDTNHSYIFALSLYNAGGYSLQLMAFTFNSTNSDNVLSPLFTQNITTIQGGFLSKPPRLSLDIHNSVAIIATEPVPATNNTSVFAYNYANHTLTQVDLGVSTFQGPISVDYNGTYYVITSQMSGYIALTPSLSTAAKSISTTGYNGTSLNGIQRNYAALGGGVMVVSGANGLSGFSPSSGDGSDSPSHTWIIVLSVLGGVVLLVFLIALGALAYHYYTKNKRYGYEKI